jgi:hypothetical protein
MHVQMRSCMAGTALMLLACMISLELLFAAVACHSQFSAAHQDDGEGEGEACSTA